MECNLKRSSASIWSIAFELANVSECVGLVNPIKSAPTRGVWRVTDSAKQVGANGPA